MSDPAVAAQRQQQRQQGLIASLVTLPFRFFGVLCGALLLCILIECVGMHFFWPEQGWRHAQGMLHYELDQLSTHFTRSALVQEPGRTAHRLVEQGYDWLFVKSGLLDWIRDASAQASAGSHRPAKDFRYYIGLVYVNVESYLIAAAYTTLVFLVRLLVLCLTLPLFLMAAFVGLVDGLVRRDIRRFGAGRVACGARIELRTDHRTDPRGRGCGRYGCRAEGPRLAWRGRSRGDGLGTR